MKALRTIRIVLALVLAIPAIYLGSFVIPQFPFTSGVIAHAFSPTGEEVCVVQTYKGIAEPYQVSLFARRPGQKWVWSYLAHQDSRWSFCRIEFAGDALCVYRGFQLNRTFSLARTTDLSAALGPLPAEYSPEQILAYHNIAHQR